MRSIGIYELKKKKIIKLPIDKLLGPFKNNNYVWLLSFLCCCCCVGCYFFSILRTTKSQLIAPQKVGRFYWNVYFNAWIMDMHTLMSIAIILIDFDAFYWIALHQAIITCSTVNLLSSFHKINWWPTFRSKYFVDDFQLFFSFFRWQTYFALHSNQISPHIFSRFVSFPLE